MERATNLVFVYNNLHLKHKVFDLYHKEEVIEWFETEKT